MNTSFTLFRLQTQDTLRIGMNTRLKEIDRIVAEDFEVVQAKDKLNDAKQSLQLAESMLKDLTNQTTEKRIKRELTQNSLFSGKVRSPKELQDLQAESHALDRVIASLEEQQLNALQQVDEAATIVKLAQDALQDVLDRKSSENARLMGEKHKIEADIPKVDAQRQALIDQLDAESFRIYRNLMKTKANRAVAEIKDDSCGTCGVIVTPADIQSAKLPTHLTFCKNCGRILYKS